MGFVGQIKLGLEANTNLGLVDQYGTGFVGPIRNWAWWASTELGLLGQTELDLVGQTKLSLMG